ncbi:MAG: GNAT family N-acetyltransferase [Promethearchaeota archaeon]
MVEIIREIQKRDRKKCLGIIITCLNEINSRNYTSEFIKHLVKSYKKNFMNRREIHTFVFEKEGNILGTGSISAEGQILDVFVDVKNHRRGIGKKIMKTLEIEANQKKMKTIFLYSAISAVDFYKNLGYFEMDRLVHKNKDVEIRMEKPLDKIDSNSLI